MSFTCNSFTQLISDLSPHSVCSSTPAGSLFKFAASFLQTPTYDSPLALGGKIPAIRTHWGFTPIG